MSREQQIDRIVADTGMDRLQAHYHLQGREAAIAADQRRRAAAARAPLDTFQPFGEVAARVVASFGGAAGGGKTDVIDQLSRTEAVRIMTTPVGELRGTIVFPLSPADFLRLKAKAVL